MNKRIPQTFINEVIARTDIVELIQSRVKLTKKGQNNVGLCPFHSEQSPSFSVNQAKQFYYCFGCGANGNAIGFLMAYDHMPFIDALEDLSAKLGLEVPSESGQPQQSFTQELASLEKVSHYYQKALRQSPEAIQYLQKERGLTGQVAKLFQVGFAPNQWDNLVRHCREKNEQEHLQSQGLIIHKDSGKTFDRFRHRIMFPIRDIRGRVIAFGGRALGDDKPKYMNSPETALFHKSQELYGLYEATRQNTTLEYILITEGYMDVISLHQFGVTQAVATLGTAINFKHIQKLLRFTDQIIFCFDGDQAGQKAAWKALTESLPHMRDGIQLRFMFLPSKDDPDSLIRRVGQQGFQQRLQKAQPLSTVFFELIKNEVPPDTPDTKAAYASKASHYINQMPQGIFRQLLLDQLSKELNVYISDLGSGNKNRQQSRQPKSKGATTLLNPAQQATALMLQEPKLHQQHSDFARFRDIPLPGIDLLLQLHSKLLQQPELTIGELLANTADENDQRAIASLAAKKLPLSSQEILAEFNGTIERLLEYEREIKAEALITKAKINKLTPEEKKKLTLLLTQKHKDLI